MFELLFQKVVNKVHSREEKNINYYAKSIRERIKIAKDTIQDAIQDKRSKFWKVKSTGQIKYIGE